MMSGSSTFLLLVVTFIAASHANAVDYTSFDDASWAITKYDLSDKLGDKQTTYDTYMQKCRDAAPDGKGEAFCDRVEADRMERNALQPQSVRNYTDVGFKKIRAPEAVYKLIKDFWDKNRDKATQEFQRASPYHNSWDAQPDILHVSNTELDGGGPPLMAAISNAARDAISEWTGQTLAPSSVYGIRVYKNTSILSPHVDRIPLICSAIINVDQDVEQDWVLEAYDHDGKAHNITMLPGDMVLYESHSTIHGRPFPLNGRYYANIFIHFETIGDLESSQELPPRGSLPPYLLEGSAWEPYYRHAMPEGWNLLTDIHGLIHRGDVDSLRYVAQRDMTSLTKMINTTDHWRYLHYAVEEGHVDVTRFFLDEVGLDVNTPIYVPFGLTPLDMAMQRFESNNKSHPMLQLLREKGGRTYRDIHGVTA